jgi:uncharacterized protein DUF222/HNH endonuclease
MICYALPARHPLHPGPFRFRDPTLALVREAPAEPYGQSPPDEADALADLGDEIATLAAHIHAATQRFLALIADFDKRRGWELDGHRSCAHWLSYRTGIDLGACREKVRTARALEGLPETRAAMARGELSFSAVRALSRVATLENEEDLLTLATGCTIAQLERTVRGWKRFSRMEESDLERERHEKRSLSVFPDHDGMYVVKGRVSAEVGALLMRALDAASDALYRDNPTRAPGDSDAERRRHATQRRADAVALLAECALAAGFGSSAGGEAGEGQCDDDPTPISGSRAERYQVVLHVDAATLTEDGEPGRSHLQDGTRVSAETSRRRSCDSGKVTMTHAPDGSILNVGRKTRTIPPALRRALDFRDRGCRFPGCGLRFTDAHHIKHWADGGETSLGNCLLLCGHHHRLLHEGGWRVTWWGEACPAFFDPRGGTHFDGRWKPPVLPERAIEVMIEANSKSGSDDAVPTGTTAGACWKREADVPDDIYFRAMEAMG